MKICILFVLMFLSVGTQGNGECIDTKPTVGGFDGSGHWDGRELSQDEWPYCSDTCNELATAGYCHTPWSAIYCFDEEVGEDLKKLKVSDTCKMACNHKDCLTPVDCKWSDWEYGQCTQTCGGGTRTNYRKEQVQQENGGKACAGSTWESQDCNTQECAVEGEIKYNDILHIINVFAGEAKGYLDSTGNSKCGNNKMGHYVETSDKSNRDRNSGSWQIVSAEGKAGKVQYGDLVRFENQFISSSWPEPQYLDTCSHIDADTTKCYNVVTSDKTERSGSTSKWKIVSKDGKTGPVVVNDNIHLLNQYGLDHGKCAYMDVNGKKGLMGGTGFSVQTDSSATRDGNSGTWKFAFAK